MKVKFSDVKNEPVPEQTPKRPILKRKRDVAVKPDKGKTKKVSFTNLSLYNYIELVLVHIGRQFDGSWCTVIPHISRL